MKSGMRQSAEKLVQRAAEAGVQNPARLFQMTPQEIEWEFRAFVARCEREEERIARLAWMIGRYFMIGVYQPKKYPQMPSLRRAMTEEELKAAFMRAAGGRMEDERTGHA